MYIHKLNNPSIQQRLNFLIHIYLLGLCNIEGSIGAIGFSLVRVGAFSLTGASILSGTFSLTGASILSDTFSLIEAISTVLFVSLTEVV
jgi:hypothetical protein